MENRSERIEALNQEKAELMQVWPRDRKALRRVNRELHRIGFGQAPEHVRPLLLDTHKAL